MKDISIEVEEYLREYHRTEKTAINARDLGTLFNVKGKPLRDIINNLRQEGIPICSSWFGYWYSIDPEDVERTVKQLESRVIHISKAIEGLNRFVGGVQGE